MEGTLPDVELVVDVGVNVSELVDEELGADPDIAELITCAGSDGDVEPVVEDNSADTCEVAEVEMDARMNVLALAVEVVEVIEVIEVVEVVEVVEVDPVEASSSVSAV